MPPTAQVTPTHQFGPPEISPHDISFDLVDDLLGTGQFGNVYKGRCRGLEVAVKILHKQQISEPQISSFRREVEMMSLINHPNVVRFMGACTQEGRLQIVTERCRTNLENLLESGAPLTFYERMRMARDAALGMTWLHGTKMVHRDLKTANLLVDFNSRIKVADFGFSKIKETDSLIEQKGTLVTMAPEMIAGHRYNERVDVYSFGIILWEIYTRQKPYPQFSDPHEFIKAVCNEHQRPELPADTPPSLRRLIKTCWHNNPAERISFSHIVERLSEIMVDCVILHERAAGFWKKYFLNHHDGDKVECEIFVECLCKEVQYQMYEGCTYLDDLMDMLMQDDPKREFVTIDRFNKIVSLFGPFYDPLHSSQIIPAISELLQQSWFHGDISSIKADSLLAQQPEAGTFLIRFSSANPTVAPFTISLSRAGNACAGHSRIERTEKGEFQVWKKTYKNLNELVKSNQGTLKVPCSKTYVQKYDAADPSDQIPF